MIPTLSPNNPDSLPSLTDDGCPRFLNAAYDGPDDLGDWWLDLGSVDLPDASTL